MVERFNGRIADLLRKHRFYSREDLEKTIHQYLAQKALDHRTPVEALKGWYETNPELFRIKPVNRPGPDT